MEAALRYRKWGLDLRATGSDEESARKVGVRVSRTVVLGYVTVSLFVFAGALILLAQLGIGDPAQGEGFTLNSITAVVLGGTMLRGGRGTFIGTLLGTGLIVQIINGTTFLGLTQAGELLFQGAADRGRRRHLQPDPPAQGVRLTIRRRHRVQRGLHQGHPPLRPGRPRPRPLDLLLPRHPRPAVRQRADRVVVRTGAGSRCRRARGDAAPGGAVGGRAQPDGADRVRQPTGVEHHARSPTTTSEPPTCASSSRTCGRARPSWRPRACSSTPTSTSSTRARSPAGAGCTSAIPTASPSSSSRSPTTSRRSGTPRRPSTCASARRSRSDRSDAGLRTTPWPSAPSDRTMSTGKSASTWTGSAPSGSPGCTRRSSASSLGALLCFDFANIRYATATHIGTWAIDKLIRFALHPARRRSDRLGLRFGGAPPPAVQPVARPRPRPRRIARRVAPRRATARGPVCRRCAAPSPRPPGSPTTSPPRSTTSSPSTA